MDNVSKKFMLVAEIIDEVLDNTVLGRDDRKLPGIRRAHYLHTTVSQLKLIEMIEAVYGNLKEEN